MRKITFHTDQKQNSFVFSVDHNGIFDHMYGTQSGILLNILKYHVDLTKIILYFKEAL